ncbi:MAG: sugar phosphate isomerase/epimerase [Planctomycetes bacterium]|nr:sugar phosphate isomerase/epimerase [Planctomycetota bacterium]
MQILTRREFVGRTATLTTAIATSRLALAEGRAPGDTKRMTLGFSTYGMKTLTTERAIDLIADIGYDAVEITVWPGWDAEPSNVDAARRGRLQKQLADRKLKLTSLMEHVYPAADTAQHKKDLERFQGVFQLARDLSGDEPPVVQTVLGGGRFEDKKNMILERVGDWVELGKKHGIVTCIKPHRGGSVSQPSEGIWILKQLAQPKWARMVYDYSHYIFRDIPFVESIRQSLPYIGHVAIKDTIKKGNGTAFVLPGEAGTIDFVTLLKELAKGGYTGDISCEVSGMVSGKPGYDPENAVKTCYKNIAPMFKKAGLKRA